MLANNINSFRNERITDCTTLVQLAERRATLKVAPFHLVPSRFVALDSIKIKSARMPSSRHMRILQRWRITYNEQVKIRLRVALILLALLLGSRTHAGHRATQDVDQDLSASLTHLAYSVFTLVYMNA